jgi:hypothetical protein
MKTIKLSRKVRVSDPCYGDDVWCKFQLTNVRPGDFKVDVTHYDDDSWGHRVSSLSVYHTKLKNYSDLKWVEYGEIGVDSGQAGIFCETTFRNDEYAEKNIADVKGQFDFTSIIHDEKGDKFYVKMCHMTVNSEDKCGIYERGVVTSSGYGDGGYPFYVVYDEDKKIVAMKIVYIFPDDADEDEMIESQIDDYRD